MIKKDKKKIVDITRSDFENKKEYEKIYKKLYYRKVGYKYKHCDACNADYRTNDFAKHCRTKKHMKNISETNK